MTSVLAKFLFDHESLSTKMFGTYSHINPINNYNLSYFQY